MATIARLLVVLGAAWVLIGCGETTNKNQIGKIKVVCTIGMLADLVQNIGGDRVDAIGLMGPGVDPHLYKASAGDVKKLEEADLIFYGGLHLEGRMAEILQKMGSGGKLSIAVGESIPETELRTPKEFQGKPDPHIWFDVLLWKRAAEAVRDGLIKQDPTGADAYRKNADSYLSQLDELHKYVGAQISAIPKEARVLITAHDAFGYFGRRYGVEVLGIQGTSTATEASVSDIQRLAKLIAERKVKAIFVESSVPRSTIEALQEAVRARGWDVKIGGSLFSDAMGQAGTPEGTYIGMVRHNVDTIVGALK